MKTVCIAHVITQLQLGGAQENTLYTVRHLDRRVFHPLLITGPGGPLETEAHSIAAPHWTAPSLVRPPSPGRDLRALIEIRNLLARLPRPLIVHTHCPKAGFLGRLAGRSVGADAVVHSVHGFALDPQQRRSRRAAYLWAERLVAPCADAYICVSRADVELGQRHALFGSARVEVIRSGISTARFVYSARARRAVRTALAIGEKTPVVATIANFKPQKGPLDFIRIAAQVSARRPDVQFLYVGDGELRPQVESLIARHRLSDRIHLVGWQRRPADYLSACDVFLLTSYYEGLPRSVLQALTAGCRVLATNTGGVAEVLPPEQLAPPGDVPRLASMVLAAFADLAPPQDVRPSLPLPPGFEATEMVTAQERLYHRLAEPGGGRP